METKDRPLVWLHGQVKSPPFSPEARLEAGYLLRLLQQGKSIGLPQSRPMPSIGSNCHELRIVDATGTWRVVYKIAADAIVILEVFEEDPVDPTGLWTSVENDFGRTKRCSEVIRYGYCKAQAP